MVSLCSNPVCLRIRVYLVEEEIMVVARVSCGFVMKFNKVGKAAICFRTWQVGCCVEASRYHWL